MQQTFQNLICSGSRVSSSALNFLNRSNKYFCIFYCEMYPCPKSKGKSQLWAVFDHRKPRISTVKQYGFDCWSRGRQYSSLLCSNESRIEMAQTNRPNHAYIEGTELFSMWSISLVFQAFYLISKAFFRKMIELLGFSFNCGLWMLPTTILLINMVVSNRKIMNNSAFRFNQ